MSQSGAKAKVQWWIFGLLLLVHVVSSISTSWILFTLAKLQNIAAYESSEETHLFSGWPFRCTDFDSTGKYHYLATQTVVDIFIAMFSSYASAVCVANAYAKGCWRFHRGVVFAFAGTLLSLIFFHFRSHVLFDPASEWQWYWQLEVKIIIFVTNLSDRIVWLSAICGLYWPLSNLGSLAKRYLNLRDGQFNLSMVLTGITFACVLFAFVSGQARSQIAQSEAIAYFEGKRIRCFSEADNSYQAKAEMNVELPLLSGRTWRDWEIESGISRYFLGSNEGLYRITVLEFGYLPTPKLDWRYLRSFPYLLVVEINGSNQLDHDMFKELARLKTLKVLDLEYCTVEDEDVAALARESSVQYLNLQLTSITDDSVDHILQMKKLRWLDVSYTQVSKEGVQRLKDGLPGCKVLCEQH